MLFISDRNSDYYPLSAIWEPADNKARILQPWKQKSIFWKSASPPVVMFSLLQFLEVSLQYDGDVAEFGVWKGGSAGLIAASLHGQNKKLHLFDTFEGIPSVSEKDNFWKPGDGKSASYEKVKEDFLMDFVSIHRGKFSDTISDVEQDKFCFVHVDCDVYESVKTVTEFVYPRMSKGGIILYDDYGDWVSQGARLAVDEFYSNIEKRFIYLPTKQAVVIC